MASSSSQGDHFLDPNDFKCVYYHTPGKRCKKGERCTWFHSHEQHTRWLEVAQRRQACLPSTDLPPAVTNFGDDQGGGFLRERTIAVKAWFAKEGLGSIPVISTTVETVEINDKRESWVRVVVQHPKDVSALAKQIKMRLDSVAHAHVWLVPEDPSEERKLLRAHQGMNLPQTVFHGSGLMEGLNCLREGVKAKAGGHPTGVYASTTLEHVILSGYNNGLVFELATCSSLASKDTYTVLKHPVPGVSMKMLGRAAMSEWCIHQDSLRIAAFWSPLHFLKSVIKESFGSAPSMKASVSFHRDERAEQRMMERLTCSDNADFRYSSNADGEPELICISKTSAGSSGGPEAGGSEAWRGPAVGGSSGTYPDNRRAKVPRSSNKMPPPDEMEDH